MFGSSFRQLYPHDQRSQNGWSTGSELTEHSKSGDTTPVIGAREDRPRPREGTSGMASNTYDAIVIGGGHNGLTSGAYFAREGARTVVLESRNKTGGAADTSAPFADHPEISVNELHRKNSNLSDFSSNFKCFYFKLFINSENAIVLRRPPYSPIIVFKD